MSTAMEKLDRIAADYHTSQAIPDIHIENLCQEYFLGWLLKQLPASSRVLELGYGDGLVTAALAGTDCEVTLIEGAKSLVDAARASHPTLECIHTMFEDFKPQQSYDVVLAAHVLEHVDEPQAILDLMTGWLRPGGKIIIVVPNCNSLHRQLAVMMGLQPQLDSLSARDHLVGHQRVYSLERLETDVRQAGLEVVGHNGFFLKVLPNSMMLDYPRELLWALNTISHSLPSNLLANIVVVARRPA